jgi:predicted TIM-barrel fold metal-dependent hydrolase
VLWGTDYPVQQFGPSLDAVRRLPLPDDARARLLGENAVRWLGL